MQVSELISRLSPSPTIAIADQARNMIKSGVDVISLGLGEPDFDTPEHIIESAYNAMKAGATRYTAVGGTIELKDAIVSKFKRDNNIIYSREEIIVSTGAKQVLYNVLMATINPGDEVILPAPYWVSYYDMVTLCGGIPVIVDCGADFILKPQALKDAITEKTKWLIFNSPNNPSGVVYSKSNVQDIVNVLSDFKNVSVLCDDIYEHLRYDDVPFYNPLMLDVDLKDRCFVVNGVSKSYSMTGWRLGYGAGPSFIVSAMCKLQSQSTSCASSVSQSAALYALNGDHSFLIERNDIFKRRRDNVVSFLNKCPGIHCRTPGGAFYVFASCENLIGKKTSKGKIIKTDEDFVSYLLSEYRVSAVHGSAFGKAGHFRISYATSDELLAEACERISKACTELSE